MKKVPIIAIALTGACCMPYGLRRLESLLRAKARVALRCSPAADVVSKQALDLVLPPRAADAQRFFSERFPAKRGLAR